VCVFKSVGQNEPLLSPHPPKIFSHAVYVWQGLSSNGVSTATLGASPAALSTNDPKQLDELDLKFSTADRTILEQLKMSIRAREDQFVLKGIGNLTVGGGQCRGKKHHPYPSMEAPYPRSYEKEVVDLWVEQTKKILFFSFYCFHKFHLALN
jgi:hypothetical protein